VLATLIAVASSNSYLLPLGFWTLLAIIGILLLLKPSLLEILFFLMPLIFPAVPALTGIPSIFITIVWMLGLLLIWYVQNCIEGWKGERIRSNFVLIFVGYTVLVIFSILASRFSTVSLTSLSQCLALIAFYWILTHTLRNQNLYRLIVAIIAGSLVGAFIFVVVLTRNMPRLSLDYLILNTFRPRLMNFNANSWAMGMIIGTPLAFALLLNKPAGNRFRKWMLPTLIFLFVAALINMSRSSLTAIGAACLFILLVHPTRKKIFFYGGGICLLLFFITLPYTYPYLDSILRLQSGLSGREHLWPLALNIIANDPVLGLGPGIYAERIFFLVSFVPNGLHKTVNLLSVHNVYLKIGVDIGIFGILLVLAIFALFAARSHQLWKRVKDTPDFPVLVAISALMVAGFLRGMFEINFAIPHGYLTENIVLVSLLTTQDRLIAKYLKDKA
jgi:O-antigen ligase